MAATPLVLVVTRCNWVTPIPAKRAPADPHTRRRLPALVLGQVDHPDDPLDVLPRETGPDELLGLEVALDEALPGDGRPPTLAGVDGRWLTAGELDERTATVAARYAAAGLAAGDIITAVDGRRAAGLTLADLRQRFRVEGVDIRLTLTRDGAERQVVLRTRRLI